MKKKDKIVYRYLKCSYLVIFDRPVRWSTNVMAMNWAGLESGNMNLQKYAPMQCIKGTSTARISVKKGKRVKLVPKVVFRFGRQGRQIKNFLETRRFILDSLKRLKNEHGHER